MLWLADTTVHTTGVNWVATVTIVVGVATVISIIGGFFVRYISKEITVGITGAIDRLRIDVISSLETRLTTVEITLKSILRKQGSDDSLHVRCDTP